MRAIEEEDISIKKDIIIEDIMKSRGLYCLVSNAKVGKSMLALQLSYSLIRGKQFLGRNVLSPSPILYISTESDFGQLKQRINVLDLKFPKESLFIIDRNGKGEVSIFDFEIDINDFVKKYKGKVVILDMLKDIDLGINYDINSYQDIGQKLLPKLRNLCEKYNITILFTHHLNKQGKTLGSTAFDAVVDGKLTLIEDKNDKSLIRLNIINRDFPSTDIYLKKSKNQIFNVIEQFDEDKIDINLVNFIKYAVNQGDCEFTCAEIINKANLLMTPKQCGRMINSNMEYLRREGLYIKKIRKSDKRLYQSHYEEPIEENE